MQNKTANKAFSPLNQKLASSIDQKKKKTGLQGETLKKKCDFKITVNFTFSVWTSLKKITWNNKKLAWESEVHVIRSRIFVHWHDMNIKRCMLAEPLNGIPKPDNSWTTLSYNYNKQCNPIYTREKSKIAPKQRCRLSTLAKIKISSVTDFFKEYIYKFKLTQTIYTFLLKKTLLSSKMNI